MTYPSPEALLIDMAKSLSIARREDMCPADLAIFDMMIMLELYQRGVTKDIHLEMRVLAMKHLKTAPYVAGLLKAISQHIDPKNNVIHLTKPTSGGNPCP